MTEAADPGWEARVERVWKCAGEYSEAEVVQAIEVLAAQRPVGDAVALYERASACDYAGRESDAEPLYRAALEAGLAGQRRAEAVIQLASTVRNLRRPDEAVAPLQVEIAAVPADGLADARAAFLALALGDAGQHERALSTALAALAPHLPRYQRAVVHYAEDLLPPARQPRTRER